ncbi:hypothetical protein BS78_05G109900 [Paspalum vaginatum]|nr:hypothetical protein BS78_05G109900 [Paspalum vaginatum]KAJ1275096.1 hypothetical protein BS78_05G109900 [Paspalum vaginatum]
MDPGGEGARIKRRAVEGDVDRLSELPEDLLRHVLSYLPSREAVQTCVLARRWRHQWKELRSLRVTNDKDFYNASDLNKFVNYLLVLRNRSSELDVVDIKSYYTELTEGHEWEEECRYIDVWIRRALELKVKSLRVCHNSYRILFEESTRMKCLLPNTPITSTHLVKLELIRVKLKDHALDFSRCPALRNLKMVFCKLSANKIVSPSLKHLSFTYCKFKKNRARISTPRIISLELVDCLGRTPFLEIMPLLVSAFIRLSECRDCCSQSYEIGGCGADSCEGCTGGNIGNNTCVLLRGLSSSAHLELTAKPTVFIFRKDLTYCPVFSKLKTLLLNDWCITAGLDPLICFIQHSPALEKLILQLAEIHEDLKEMGVSYDTKKQSFVSKNLTVEVKCHEQDGLVHKILEVLSSCGIPDEKIKILPPARQIRSRCNNPWHPGSLSFEQERT